MLSEEAGNISPTTVTPKSRQRDSGHLAVSPPARCPDSEPGSADARSETRLWANRAGRGACVPALKPRRSREGPWKKCQGFKPDLRDPAVRDYRGAPGNVAMVEMRTHLATERAGMVIRTESRESEPNGLDSVRQAWIAICCAAATTA